MKVDEVGFVGEDVTNRSWDRPWHPTTEWKWNNIFHVAGRVLFVQGAFIPSVLRELGI